MPKSKADLLLVALPPAALYDAEFGGCFGMCEMEIAAKIIVQKCVNAQSWLTDIDRTMFVDYPNGLALDGFDELIQNDWLVRKYGDHWHVVGEFVERLMKRKPEAFTNG